MTIQVFQLGRELHPQFDMPMLTRLNDVEICAVNSKVSKIILKILHHSHSLYFQSVQFKFSAQHDCRMGHCKPSAFRFQMQEREQTTRKLQLIAHEDDKHFVLNLHALHNVVLLRRALPRHLTIPIPLYQDRKAQHFAIAAQLRVSQADKRAKTAAKTKATRERNASKNIPQAAQQALVANNAASGDELDIQEGETGHVGEPSSKRRRT